jgi:hypothetical protein
MASTLRHAGALALLLPLTAIAGCPFHEEVFQHDCTKDADCNEGNPCIVDTCTPPAKTPSSSNPCVGTSCCTHTNSPAQTVCDTAKQDVCDGDGHCVECVTYGDCQTVHPTSPICDAKTHTCVSCTDGVQDGLEEGVDCGGPDCGACLGAPCVCSSMFTPTMMACPMGCATGTPGGAGGECVDHAYGDCGDMTFCVSQSRNPDDVCCSTACNNICEGCVTSITGMPTGTCGPVPFGMDPYDDCTQTGTPTAGGCGKSPNTCACNDKVQDGAETDVDCGGGTCPGCGGGQKCNVDSDCGASTPACTGGMCCNMVCVGECTACNAMGQCVAVPGKSASMCTNGLVCGSTLNFPCIGRAGAMCSPSNLGEDCLSGVCQSSSKTCAKSASGGACNMSDDCATGTCTNFVCM